MWVGDACDWCFSDEVIRRGARVDRLAAAPPGAARSAEAASTSLVMHALDALGVLGGPAGLAHRSGSFVPGRTAAAGRLGTSCSFACPPPLRAAREGVRVHAPCCCLTALLPPPSSCL